MGPVMDRMSALGGRRVLVLGAGLVAVVAVLLIASFGTGPAWVPVMGSVPIEKMGEVTSALQEAGIEHRLTAGGSRVEVAESELARARVELASRGLPGEGGPGFELFDQPAWGMTDFTQRINFRRALEGELERTIRDMDGVESARVHLALQQSSVLRRNARPTEASVVVRMRSGARPTAGLVEGVAFLVASSVDELSSEHVTVLDHTGRLLSRSVEAESAFGLTSRQLELRSSVEEYLEGKAAALLGDVVGAGNVRVRVAAELNLDRVDRTVQAVNPDQQMVTREERTEITPGPEDVGAGSVAYKTDYEATRSVEHYSSGGGQTRRLSVAVLVNEVAGADGALRTPEELDRIEALVAAAVGLDRDRGDVISVVSVPFEEGLPLPTAAPAGPDIWEIVNTLQRPVLTVLALLIAFVLGLRAIRTVASPKAGRAALPAGAVAGEGTALPGAADGSAADGDLMVKGGARPAAVEDKGARLRKQLSAAQAQRMQEVTSGVIERPDLAARVVQAWLKG